MKACEHRLSRATALSYVFSLVLTGVTQAALAGVNCGNITPIYAIQGKNHISPYLGQEVETCGVVTAVAFDGYYLQDAQGDDATSDGIDDGVIAAGEDPVRTDPDLFI